MKHTYTNNYSLFTSNSSVNECPIFYLSTHVQKGICHSLEAASTLFANDLAL